MKLSCRCFGHKWSRPEFNQAQGVWSETCVRGCGEHRKGITPDNHAHVYGKKFRRAGVYFQACPCGHVEEAEAPVKRVRKAVITP